MHLPQPQGIGGGDVDSSGGEMSRANMQKLVSLGARLIYDFFMHCGDAYMPQCRLELHEPAICTPYAVTPRDSSGLVSSACTCRP